MKKITDIEKAELFEKARNAILFFLKNGKAAKTVPSQTNGILQQKSGVFISIYIDKKLRGCIGGFACEKTLNEMVQTMAVSAACDRRFDPIKNDEAERIKLEISILSPLKEIKSSDEIELGKHGIFIRQGLNSGTFLPQVATKTKWTVEEFLGHCARDKAHIGWEGWKTAELFTYEAIILKEE